ncbi:MAG: homoserine kinase [Armatimonadia bacterium]|nr:homoserine kinase [Armatimonadia bacterium]
MDSVTIHVPATTANLGPGYDCLGLALGLRNEVTLAPADAPGVEIAGEGAQSLPRDHTHLVLGAAQAAADAAGERLPVLALRQVNRIPLARGMGSSSAAIVGGIVAANELLDLGLSQREMLDVATRVEGHPDNVAPALLGGLTVCCTLDNGEVLCERMDVAEGLSCVVAIPDFEVATHDARKALPDTIDHADGVFNLCRVGLIVACLVSGDFGVLGEAMRDRLHQPHRAHLVPGMDDAIAAALDAGAHGAALSGSGPTVAAFVSGNGEEVGRAMVNAFDRAETTAIARELTLSTRGATVVV